MDIYLTETTTRDKSGNRIVICGPDISAISYADAEEQCKAYPNTVVLGRVVKIITPSTGEEFDLGTIKNN